MASCCFFKAVIFTADQDVIDYSLYTFQSSWILINYSQKFFRCYTYAKGIHPPKRLSARGFLHLIVQAVLIKAKENTLVSIANFCKQMLNSWAWILISLECDVQWSTAYAEFISILSRRFAVYSCRGTYPFSGLSHFLKWTLLLEVFYFSNKTVF